MAKSADYGLPNRKSGSVWEKLIYMVMVFVIIIGAGQAASQYFASVFNYNEALGGINHFYPPWSIIKWSMDYADIYPEAVSHAKSIGLVTIAIGFLGLIAIKVFSKNNAKASAHLHGSARWATKKDIQSAGLLPTKEQSDGVYVGGWVDKRGQFYYLRHNGPEHVLTYAPTRSGKGVGLVLPTLLSWTHSAFITDLKGELWELTAGWRKEYAGNKVIRFEPAHPSSARWNPLDEIRVGTEHEVGDVQNVAMLILDPDGKGLKDHWQKTSYALLTGVILHAVYRARNGDGPPATLPLIDHMLADTTRDIAALWAEMKTYSHYNGQNHPAVGAAAQDMTDRPDEEAGSVLSTAKSYLALYRDPIVARNVGASDFKIKDIMQQTSPASLYVITTPDEKTRLRPLIRIMVAMTVRLLTGRMKFNKGQAVVNYKHRLLMMMDEFPSLGKIEVLQESLAFLAGYGIKCYLICQDISQLRSREIGYGHDESITSNCHVQNAFQPNRVETAEHLSKMTGTTTAVKEQVTISGKRGSALLGQVSKTFQEVQRPLLTPDECLRMPGAKKNKDGQIDEAGDMLIYVAGYPAIYGKQPLYFKDAVFSARAAVPAPRRTDRFYDAPAHTTVSDDTPPPQIHL
jgi:type IV secretion system protein VirD4